MVACVDLLMLPLTHSAELGPDLSPRLGSLSGEADVCVSRSDVTVDRLELWQLAALCGLTSAV